MKTVLNHIQGTVSKIETIRNIVKKQTFPIEQFRATLWSDYHPFPLLQRLVPFNKLQNAK